MVFSTVPILMVECCRNHTFLSSAKASEAASVNCSFIIHSLPSQQKKKWLLSVGFGLVYIIVYFSKMGFIHARVLFLPKTGPTLPMSHNLVLSSRGSIAIWSPFPHKLGRLFSSADDWAWFGAPFCYYILILSLTLPK